ncbi:hypothetical protein ACHAWF_010701 [Thalassiosira exigua]
MDSLINGIIDCVARPSTTDSPVRVLRKSASESPNCVSADPGLTLSTSALSGAGADSDSDSTNTIPHPPNHVRGASNSSLSRLMVPGEATPINSVLTAEGIIMGDDRGFICGTCGDCATCYDAGGDDGTISSEPIDSAVVRQFEAAFATFLYKNPAFTSMSHTTLQKLRAKLSKECAKNIKVESELRKQLADLREAKRNRELELQRELLVVTRAKAAREAELLVRIQKTRRSSMMLEQKMNGNDMASPNSSPQSSPCTATSWLGLGSSPPNTPPAIAGSESFEEFQNEIRKNKMEQAHIYAEIEKIKMQMASESVNGSP